MLGIPHTSAFLEKFFKYEKSASGVLESAPATYLLLSNVASRLGKSLFSAGRPGIRPPQLSDSLRQNFDARRLLVEAFCASVAPFCPPCRVVYTGKFICQYLFLELFGKEKAPDCRPGAQTLCCLPDRSHAATCVLADATLAGSCKKESFRESDTGLHLAALILKVRMRTKRTDRPGLSWFSWS